MLGELCTSCRRHQAELTCGVCQGPCCKSCVQFLDAATFSFLPEIPGPLGHTYYCGPCHEAEVEPSLLIYQETLERAKGLYFFFSTQRKRFPLIRRSKVKVAVKACEDRNETILRLAFLAAQQGYNSVIEAEVLCEKVRNEGYQKSCWRGVGFPAQVDADRVDRY